jgi:hypothetical protein
MVHFTWATKYEFHAGFLPNIRLKQIKQKITKGTLFDESQAIEQFENNLEEIFNYKYNRIKLYTEKNMISEANYKSFNQVGFSLLYQIKILPALKNLMNWIFFLMLLI